MYFYGILLWYSIAIFCMVIIIALHPHIFMRWVVENRCITIIKYWIFWVIKCDQRYVSQVLYVGIIATYRHYCYSWNNGVTCEGFRCDSRRLSCSQSLEFCSLKLTVAVHLLAVFLGFYKFYAGEVLFQSPIELFVMSDFPQSLFTEKFCHTRPCKYELDSSNHLLPTIRLITYTSYTAWMASHWHWSEIL